MSIIFSLFHTLYLINILKANYYQFDPKFLYTKNNKRELSTNVNSKINEIIYIESIDDKVSYISSFKSEDGTVYLATNTENTQSKKRLIYRITSSQNNYYFDYKILSIDINSHNKYALITLINIKNKEYIVSLSHEGQFELFDYDNGQFYYCSFFKVLTQNSIITKNTFTSLKYYNNSDYVLNVYVDKHDFYFLIQKISYLKYNITKSSNIKSTQIKFEQAYKSSSVTCFEIDKFVECLWTNSDLLYTISIFNITDLNNIYNETIETNPISFEQLFSKCIYVKNNIGVFIYFISYNHFPIIKFKELVINENNYELNDYFESININSQDIFPLGSCYIFNDIIKIDENNIFYISTTNDSTEIYLILFKLLNDDKNILVNYYIVKINEIYNIRIYKDIATFTINGLLGIGMTNYDYDNDINKTYSSFFLLGNYSYNNYINIPDDVSIFNIENEIKINEIININNNIFGYLSGIKIISFIDEVNTGFYIYSKNQNKNININDFIYFDDIINFKMNNITRVKLGKYVIEYLAIIKEEEFEKFISYSNYTEYFPNSEIDYKSFYHPKTIFEQKSFFNIIINKCYEACEKCSYFGDKSNNRCETCSENYPFYFITSTGKNCFQLCPDNYLPNENKQCVLPSEINNCEKLFYVDNNLKINCINGDICIDEYPHLDENIKNKCTNCLVKYNNKCYMECPKNTCIKQVINLNECIDIESNMKVINNICFENFEDIAKNIKDLSDNNIIIENIPNLVVYAYDINKDADYFINNKLTYIYFESIKDIIIKNYNLDKDTNIYALLVNSPSKYSNSSINDFDFVLLFENGTQLNLSNIKEELKVNISIPITNLDLVNYNYALELSEQGYDIYDQNSSFYHDICIPGYLNDSDIILKERKEIYPNNVTTGKTNCLYKLVDLNNQRFVYECNISGNNNFTNEVNNFEDNEENNVKNYVLDFINYKILNCSILFYDINNYRHNKSVMICTTHIFISFLLFFIFLFRGLSKIRIIMHNEIPTDQKIKQILIEYKERIRIFNYKRMSNFCSNPNKRKSQSIKKNSKNWIKPKKSNISYTFENIQNSNSNIKQINDKDINKSKKDNIIITKNNFFNIKQNKKESIINKPNLDNDNIEYDDLPLSLAINEDKRSVLKIFGIKIIEKIDIIDIFVNKEIKETLLSKYCLVLLIDLTMNALLYSDQIVSHRRHNDGKLDFFISLLLSSFSNILASIIGYYLQLLIGFEERINKIKEIKKEIVFLRVFKIIYREIIIRVIIFFIIEILIILFCFYYLFIFFTIYHKSQMSMLGNYCISILERWLINLTIALIIAVFRKIGIHYNNKYIYNTSKYIDKNF